jgi:hypothetical protein
MLLLLQQQHHWWRSHKELLLALPAPLPSPHSIPQLPALLHLRVFLFSSSSLTGKKLLPKETHPGYQTLQISPRTRATPKTDPGCAPRNSSGKTIAVSEKREKQFDFRSISERNGFKIS